MTHEDETAFSWPSSGPETTELFSAFSGVTQVGLEEDPFVAEDRCFRFGPSSGGAGCVPRIRFPRPW